MIRSTTRKCANKACGTRFAPTERHPFAIACCMGCEIILSARHIEKVNAARAKAAAKKNAVERKETKAKIAASKGLSYWEGRAQHAVNTYVRWRDINEPCISCGITYSDIWHAGHYIAVGANSTLRFNIKNIHKQCVQCNYSKSGNQILYRINLLGKIGADEVSVLEGWHETKKSTVDECQAIEREYTALARAAQIVHRDNMEAA